MKMTTDRYTVKHRLTFTPNEIFAGLALLFPDTFRDLDDNRTEMYLGEGESGDGCCEVSWDETGEPISTQIDIMRGEVHQEDVQG